MATLTNNLMVKQNANGWVFLIEKTWSYLSFKTRHAWRDI